MTWSLAVFDGMEALPAEAGSLFAGPAGGDLFATREWYRCVIETALQENVRPCLVLCLQGGRPKALFPLQRDAGGALQSLTTPYTCLYRPLLAAGLDAEALFQIGRSFGCFCRPHAAIRFEAMDPDWPEWPPLLRGMRSAGFAALRFDHFGNWHERLPGDGWAEYLQSRDGALRETIRRRLGRAQRDKAIEFAVICGGSDLETGIDAFEEVYARSWKEPEPFPDFNAGFMRAAAGADVLRLGVLRRDRQAIAVQYWVVTGRVGSVLKLAHDEAFKPISPGTVLTALMIRSLLENDLVTELDFGRGDDPYKRQWAGKRRQRIGLVLANPRRPAGLLLILAHWAGRIRRRVTGSPSACR
jgi:hypothetical protein